MKKITLTLAAIVAAITMNAQEITLFESDFSTGDFSDFGEVVNSASTENFQVITVGTHDNAASANYDEALVPQDERLITPSMDFTNLETAEIEFNWFASYHWAVDPNDNYDLKILISTDGGNNYTSIWDESMGQSFTSTDDNFLWLEERGADLEVVDLTAYAGMDDVRVALQYIGVDGAQGAFDDITIRGSENLSVNNQNLNGFNHYVANNVLTLKANTAINNTRLYNILGQQVISKKLGAQSADINLNSLNSGVYLVQVEIEGQSKSFKIVKK